jgi:hypothetical protein
MKLEWEVSGAMRPRSNRFESERVAGTKFGEGGCVPSTHGLTRRRGTFRAEVMNEMDDLAALARYIQS